jgi:hypothetical protein
MVFGLFGHWFDGPGPLKHIAGGFVHLKWSKTTKNTSKYQENNKKFEIFFELTTLKKLKLGI